MRDKKTYKVVAAWSVWFWQSPERKEFFTDDIALAEDAFDEYVRQKAGRVKLIEINEKGEETVMKSFSFSSSTTSTST